MIFLHKSKFPFFLRLFLVFLDSNNLLPMNFQFSELGIKLKLVHGIPLDKWNWLTASSFWLTDFVWKQFLVYTLHTSNVTKAVKLSFFSFYQRLLLVQISSWYHLWKLRFQGRKIIHAYFFICTHEKIYQIKRTLK